MCLTTLRNINRKIVLHGYILYTVTLTINVTEVYTLYIVIETRRNS